MVLMLQKNLLDLTFVGLVNYHHIKYACESEAY